MGKTVVTNDKSGGRGGGGIKINPVLLSWRKEAGLDVQTRCRNLALVCLWLPFRRSDHPLQYPRLTAALWIPNSPRQIVKAY